MSIPLPTSSLEVEIGPGIKVEKGQYFALLDGFLKIDGHKIEVLEAYVHEGDINLTSGDIQFKGNIVINGSVDTGSTIVSSKDIIINGDVRDGFVHCGGNLTVAGHIITGKGKVLCNGDIKAEFIENSNVFCKGSIYAQKSILSSSVYARNDIILSGQKTKLAGSDVVVWGNLETDILGFEKGTDTVVCLGSDWTIEKRLERLRKRKNQFEELYLKSKNEHADIVRKVGLGLTKRISYSKKNLYNENDKIKADFRSNHERLVSKK